MPPAAMIESDTALARLEVDLAAVVANWRALGVLHPGGPVAGVVKADAYGLGAAQVARRCMRRGAGISLPRICPRRWPFVPWCRGRWWRC